MTIQAMMIYTRANSNATRKKLKDLSEGGLCFKSSAPFDKGATVHLRIPVAQPAFEVKGTVTWCRKENDYEVGVQFNDEAIDHKLRMVGQACTIKHYTRQQRKNGYMISTDQAAREWVMEYGIVDKIA
jgi:hypothetical protein